MVRGVSKLRVRVAPGGASPPRGAALPREQSFFAPRSGWGDPATGPAKVIWKRSFSPGGGRHEARIQRSGNDRRGSSRGVGVRQRPRQGRPLPAGGHRGEGRRPHPLRRHGEGRRRPGERQVQVQVRAAAGRRRPSHEHEDYGRRVRQRHGPDRRCRPHRRGRCDDGAELARRSGDARAGRRRRAAACSTRRRRSSSRRRSPTYAKSCRCPPMADFYERVAEMRRGGERFAVATVVARRPPVSAHLGDRAIVFADGRMDGFVGGACSREIVRKQALEAMGKRQARLVSIRPDASERRLERRARRRADDVRVGGRDRRVCRAVRAGAAPGCCRRDAGRGRVDERRRAASTTTSSASWKPVSAATSNRVRRRRVQQS